jgi:pyruvate dehydrogenase E1 component alpha subunit
MGGLPGPLLEDARAPAPLGDDDLGLLLLIRHFELAVLALFAAGQVVGTTHACLGQEYVPVAVTPLLMPAFVLSNHRGHGHYLAQFRDPAGLLAEITGRAGGVCGGRGGSQHLYREGFCSTGVQGEGVAVALGLALHMKTASRPDLAAAYMGDGTWGEGVVYEALNMAQLWRVPLVLLVENNGIAQSTPAGRAMAGSIAGRAAAFGVRYAEVTATCPLAIRRQLAGPVSRARDGAGPLVVEFRTHRLGPHSKGDDTRDAAELAAIGAWDWYARYQRHHREQFERADEDKRRLVAAVVADVLARPLAGETAG